MRKILLFLLPMVLINSYAYSASDLNIAFQAIKSYEKKLGYNLLVKECSSKTFLKHAPSPFATPLRTKIDSERSAIVMNIERCEGNTTWQHFVLTNRSVGHVVEFKEEFLIDKISVKRDIVILEGYTRRDDDGHYPSHPAKIEYNLVSKKYRLIKTGG